MDKTIPFVAALIGGIVVAVVALVAGISGDGDTKTVVAQVAACRAVERCRGRSPHAA